MKMIMAICLVCAVFRDVISERRSQMVKARHIRKGMLLVGMLVTIAVPNTTFGDVYAATHFDAGLEGWTAVGDGSISWQAIGGNPGGYLRAVDPAYGINTDAVAPTPFLGDWSALNGIAILSSDLTVISGGGLDEGPMFQISGPEGAAYVRWSPTAGPPHGQWGTFAVPLKESEWVITRGTWGGLLSDVTSLQIDLEFIGGVETTGLDNVVLTPEPATLLLFGLGGLVAMRKCRAYV
jgi:hypothetical protein